MVATLTKFESLKRVLPLSLKRTAKALLLDRKLLSAIERIAKLEPHEVPSTEMLADLQLAWNNEGFTARPDFLMEVARLAATTSGPILECGSGVTTLLAGLIAGRRGIRTFSLEHDPEWWARVNKAIDEFEIPGVEVLLCPLKGFDGFDWYDAPGSKLPPTFDSVICDGPPGETKGGRYGLLAVLGERISTRTVILLDDTERPGEAEVLARWLSEADLEVSIQEHAEGSFAKIRRQQFAARVINKTVKTSAPEFEKKVSVIIPAFNVAQYITESLDSVFAQTCTDFEVIVINDGSPDSEELELKLKPYLDRIRYFKQENRGAGAARNAGLRLARGELVAFLDADDSWLTDYLAEQIGFLRDRSCDLVCADALYFNSASHRGKSFMTSLMAEAPASGEITFLQLIASERHLVTSGVVARRQTILDAGMFDETLRNSQDFDLWLRLARGGASLSYQKKALLKYRQRSDGLTGDKVNCIRRELRMFDKIEETYDLTHSERDSVLPIIRRQRTLLEFELGKVFLARSDFTRARESFTRAQELQHSFKHQVVLLLTRLVPQVMQRIAASRI